MKKIISAILSIALFAFVAVSCENPKPSEPEKPETPVTPVPEPEPEKDPLQLNAFKVSPEQLSLEVGQEATLKITTDPTDYPGKIEMFHAPKIKGVLEVTIGTDKTIRVKALAKGTEEEYTIAFRTESSTGTFPSNQVKIKIVNPASAPAVK